MDYNGRKIGACWPTKLLMFMLPLIVATALVSVVVPVKSLTGGNSASNYSWLWSSIRSQSSSSSPSSVTTYTPVPPTFQTIPVVHAQYGGDTASADVAPVPAAVEVQRMEVVVPDDLAVSAPASPPVAVESPRNNQPNATKDDNWNFTMNATPGEPVLNEPPHGLVEKSMIEKKEYASLMRLEASLRRARTGIKEAKSGGPMWDPDYAPIGPMYRNAKAFHRSYLEMEREFKIFIYEEGDPPVFHSGPCKSIYASEGNFIHMVEMNNHFRTRDPEKAHMFFLPFSVAMMVQFVYIRDSHDFGPIKRTVIDYIGSIAAKYPFWNRSLGADHFMLACHDWGPEASFTVPYLHKNSVRVLCNANTSEGFNPSKDVSLPEVNLRTGEINGFIGGPSPSHRPILAFFAGGLHGPIRPILLQHWENKDADIKVHRYLPKGVSYYSTMRKSKFCICPSGYEVASPRVVEAIYTGCVPVLISDHYVPPFSDVLNWKSFSVEVPVAEIPNLKRILWSISPRQYIRMQRRVVQIRRHFEVNFPPKRYDVFHMILHSVWLRRLNVKLSGIRIP